MKNFKYFGLALVFASATMLAGCTTKNQTDLNADLNANTMNATSSTNTDASMGENTNASMDDQAGSANVNGQVDVNSELKTMDDSANSLDDKDFNADALSNSELKVQ